MGSVRIYLRSLKAICTDTIASDVYETHIATWDRNEDKAEEPAWVAGLRAGDHIIVNAHAR